MCERERNRDREREAFCVVPMLCVCERDRVNVSVSSHCDENCYYSDGRIIGEFCIVSMNNYNNAWTENTCTFKNCLNLYVANYLILPPQYYTHTFVLFYPFFSIICPPCSFFLSFLLHWSYIKGIWICRPIYVPILEGMHCYFCQC